VTPLPPPVAAALEVGLGAAPVAAVAVGGGSINHAARVTLADGRAVFVKHHPDAPPGAFAAEAHGLAWLAEAGALRTPRVLAVGEEAGARFLALEWIAPSSGVDQSSAASPPDRSSPAERFGRGLAGLHRHGAPSFGLDRDNVIGPLPQVNTPAGTWAAFYAERRLLPLARMAVEAGGMGPGTARAIDVLAARLPDLCGPPEPPARLHGDLWAGNAIIDAEGGPVVLDPAVHGGHREMDLAMMRLFGGFPPAAHAAYAEEFPPAPGHEERVELFQLYPLLVHAVLFGGSYGASVERIVRRYAGAGRR